jgi:hypothetical protein
MDAITGLVVRGIKCDNPACDFNDDSFTWNGFETMKEYLNKPCPKCGANLFTQADYEAMTAIMGAVALGEVLAKSGIIPPEILNNKTLIRCDMDGTGSIKLTPDEG